LEAYIKAYCDQGEKDLWCESEIEDVIRSKREFEQKENIIAIK
jgi:hypothetical protein